MKRILFVLLATGFCITTSCAQKQKMIPADVVVNDASIDKKQKEKELAAKLAAEAKKDLAYTCLVAGDSRTVTLDKGKQKCKVNYTKHGEMNEVAWGQSHPEICQTAFDKIRTNIEGAGFKCQQGLNAPTAKKPVETASAQ